MVQDYSDVRATLLKENAKKSKILRDSGLLTPDCEEAILAERFLLTNDTKWEQVVVYLNKQRPLLDVLKAAQEGGHTPSAGDLAKGTLDMLHNVHGFNGSPDTLQNLKLLFNTIQTVMDGTRKSELDKPNTNKPNSNTFFGDLLGSDIIKAIGTLLTMLFSTGKQGFDVRHIGAGHSGQLPTLNLGVKPSVQNKIT
jgi:hypothetical protein